MNRLRIMTILAAAFCVALSSHAQTPVSTMETWTNSDTDGWTNNPSQTTLSNPGGYLNMQFWAQASPDNQADVMLVNVAPGTLFTNISFNFFAADTLPSEVRLCLHSTASDSLWYVILSAPPQGEWTAYDVPVDFSMATWIVGPDNSEYQFRRDMLSVDWVGVYVRRHSDVVAQNYAIANFGMQGVTIPAGVSVSGAVQYSGDQGGPIHVWAFGGATGIVSTVISEPGSYQLTGLPIATDYAIFAYRDSNNNGTQEFWEATGSWTGNPARIYISGLTGVDITMTDPMTWDGLPYWWVLKYFPAWQIGSTASLGAMDSIGNGMSNYAKYVAGLNPTNFLSVFSVDIQLIDLGDGTRSVVVGWNSVSNRTYSVWRTADLTQGFTKIASGIAARPPWNEYQDPDAVDGSSYFYRVQVE